MFCLISFGFPLGTWLRLPVLLLLVGERLQTRLQSGAPQLCRCVLAKVLTCNPLQNLNSMLDSHACEQNVGKNNAHLITLGYLYFEVWIYFGWYVSLWHGQGTGYCVPKMICIVVCSFWFLFVVVCNGYFLFWFAVPRRCFHQPSIKSIYPNDSLQRTEPQPLREETMANWGMPAAKPADSHAFRSNHCLPLRGNIILTLAKKVPLAIPLLIAFPSNT